MSTPPFMDVNQLPLVSVAAAANILAAAMQAGSPAVPAAVVDSAIPPVPTKPGVERWGVKTGQDSDIGAVAKNVFGGHDFGMGIVPATVEQLINIPRPSDMTPANRVFPAFQSKRRSPVEVIVWQLEGSIIFLKLESDGDYHLVLQGSSGDTLIVEVPTPTRPFIGATPWFQNIKAARAAVDDKLVSTLSPADFVLSGKFLVPRQAGTLSAGPPPSHLPHTFRTPPEGQEASVPLFKTAIKSTPARVTGVGFFDELHGQTGVALLNGIELHPVLKIEWL